MRYVLPYYTISLFVSNGNGFPSIVRRPIARPLAHPCTQFDINVACRCRLYFHYNVISGSGLADDQLIVFYPLSLSSALCRMFSVCDSVCGMTSTLKTAVTHA